MEQFRQIGEVVGSLKALMVFQNNILNQRQCCLLVDMLTSGYKTIAQQMKHNLRFEERNSKWKIIEHPLKELLRVFKEGETYIKQCLETKDWWAKAIVLYQNADCVEFHIHNLLAFFPIRNGRTNIGLRPRGDAEEEYLVSQDFCNRLDSVWEDDRWFLLKKIKDKKSSGCLTSKRDRRLADVLLKYLNCSETLMDDVLLPSATLVNSKDYQVRRRLGNGSQYKEIQWLDEEKKECHLVMELMNRDLSSYIKEICGPRKRIPFTLPVAVDLMLQIARGMEYLHSKKIYHGELNPSNILIKARNISTEGYLHAKVSGFGLSSSISSLTPRTPTGQNGQLPFIWYAPEVLAEQERFGEGENSKYTEKSDVYSFGMICFELLTGKVPFEDTHLQGDKMSRNIRAGERPLFPFHSPKYITNLTKKCWHIDPGQRPSFSSICRILRYTKRFLVMNPEYSQPDAPMPPVDFSDLEAGMLRSIPSVVNSKLLSVSQIPFHMFVYRVMEREKANTSQRENYESGSEGASTCGEEIILADDPLASPTERRSLPSPEIMIRKLTLSKRSLEMKTSKQPGTPKGRSVRPPHTPRTMRMNSESQLMTMSPRTRRTSGHLSDSELS
ncbi:Light-sensor Protein kinase [Sesamum angolense]|uniref:Light-sensor Protein kinase n=1 Tax=Sesamum angolense TaxID=2727404 RepID=A0AAE1XGE0_9LAMI|nr:Light-sensor Protein kinase [Sesamum angolense]